MPAHEPVACSISRSNIAALFQPLGFQQAAHAVELLQADLQLHLDLVDRLVERRARRHMVRVGVDLHLVEVAGLLPGQRIELGDRSISSPNSEMRQARSS
jgi:hypothetical protein